MAVAVVVPPGMVEDGIQADAFQPARLLIVVIQPAAHVAQPRGPRIAFNARLGENDARRSHTCATSADADGLTARSCRLPDETNWL